jgi:transcriptional regulator with GAF, ATPase, and Fis domain
MSNLELIESSARFRTVLDQINMVEPVESAVLIQSEKGTGKEVIAQAIHRGGPRRHKRFAQHTSASGSRDNKTVVSV